MTDLKIDEINGTLVLPEKSKNGIIFLHSCERSHRDEDYFPELSDYLKDYGISSYRYDSPKNAFLQSFIDRKNEAIAIYRGLSEIYPDISWGFQGLSEGAVIALLASRELPESFIIPAALELSPYSVDRLLGFISDATDGNEEEIFLSKLWFDFFGLRELTDREINSFSKIDQVGPWTPLLGVRGKDLSGEEMLNLTLECYTTQKGDFGNYQYMDYFINDVIENNLDSSGFTRNLELWKEFTEVDPVEYISNVPAFIVWGELDDEIDVPKNKKMVEELMPQGTKTEIYRGFHHGLWDENGFSKKFYKDIKDWIINGK